MADDQSREVSAPAGRRRGVASSTVNDDANAQINARQAPDGSIIAGGQTNRAAAGWGNATASEPSFGSAAPKVSHTSQEISAGLGKHVFAAAIDRETDTVSIIKDAAEAETADDLALRIAAPPRNVGRKVASLHELEHNDGLAALNVGSSRTAGIDLSFLTAVLASPEQLAEPDEPWDFDRLLQEVAQDIDAVSVRREVDGAAVRAANVGSSNVAGTSTALRPVGAGATVTAGRRAV